jgi:hypothetical protein
VGNRHAADPMAAGGFSLERVVSETTPSVIVLAGPNGAGKSTAAPLLLKQELGVDEFVNADVIAAGLSAFEPERVAAGRILRTRIHELARCRARFAFETTLAARTFAPWLASLKETGYALYQPLAAAWYFCDDFRSGAPVLIAVGSGTQVDLVFDVDLWTAIRTSASHEQE